MTALPDNTPESILADPSWVHRLAAKLVRDPHLAADAAQDACLQALQRGEGSRSTSWLARVLGNLMRQEHRSRKRRAEREADVSGPDPEPAPPDVLERADRQRAVLDAVLGLEDPYRQAILLRYYDDLQPREIAEHLGIPVTTVYAHLHRGVRQLRARLGRDPRERHAFLAPLLVGPERLPLPSGTGTAALPLAGALIMNTGWKVAGAALLLGGVTYLLWPSDGGPALPANGPTDPSAVIPPEVGHAARQSQPQRVRGDAADDPGQPESQTKAGVVADGAGTIRGKLVNVEGRPLAGMKVVASGTPEAAATTAADGTFAIGHELGSQEIEVAQAGWTTLLAGVAPEGSVHKVVVVASPSLALAGRVIDPFGASIPDALLVLRPAEGALRGISDILDRSQRRRFEVRADANGRFDFGNVPQLSEATLRVTRDGFRQIEQAPPTYSESSLEVVMSALKIDESVLTGQVLDADGAAVVGSLISLGPYASTRSTEGGQFRLPLDGNTNMAKSLRAVAPGHLPGVIQAMKADDQRQRWPAYAVIRLAGPPLTIHGTVVGEDGKPRPGMRVWPLDTEPFGAVDTTPTWVESILADNTGRSDDPMDPDGMWPFVITDADGAFEVGGLLDRSYRLAALDPATAQLVESTANPAGTAGVRIVIPDSGVHPTVTGKVVEDSGEPVPGVHVILIRKVAEMTLPRPTERRPGMFRGAQQVMIGPGGVSAARMMPASRAVTDENGRFSMSRVPKDGVFLYLRGDNILETQAEVGDDPLALEIHVVARTHLQVQLTGSGNGAPTAFELHAPDGTRLELTSIRGGEINVNFRGSLVDGRSEVLAVDPLASTLVLFKDDLEVSRKPLNLRAGQRNVVR